MKLISIFALLLAFTNAVAAELPADAKLDRMNPTLNEKLSQILGYPTDQGTESTKEQGYRFDISLSKKEYAKVLEISGKDRSLEDLVIPAIAFLAKTRFTKVCHDKAGSLYGNVLPPDSTCSGGCKGIPRNKQTYIVDGLVCQAATRSTPPGAKLGIKLICYDPKITDNDATSIKFPELEASIYWIHSHSMSVVMSFSSVNGLLNNDQRKSEKVIAEYSNDLTCVDLTK